MPGNYVQSLTFDNEGSLWIGTDGGLAKLQDSNWTVYNSSNSGLKHNSINIVKVDQNNNIWLSVTDFWNYNDGVVKFDGLTWTSYDVSNSGLQSNYIKGIELIVKEIYGLVQCMTVNIYGGLTKYDGQNWTEYNEIQFRFIGRPYFFNGN